MGKRGVIDCQSQGGSDILLEDECRKACEHPDINKTIQKLKNNKRCYIASNKKWCKQTGQPNAKTYMVCRKTGNTYVPYI